MWPLRTVHINSHKRVYGVPKAPLAFQVTASAVTPIQVKQRNSLEVEGSFSATPRPTPTKAGKCRLPWKHVAKSANQGGGFQQSIRDKQCPAQDFPSPQMALCLAAYIRACVDYSVRLELERQTRITYYPAGRGKALLHYWREAQ